MPATADATTPTFEEIAPVVLKYAAACLRCPDQQSLALTLAWYYWHLAPDKHYLPASVWARVGVRHVLAGRDIPGLRSKFRDAMKHRETQGARMNGLADRRPGPERTVMASELFDRLWSRMTPREWEMAEMLIDGAANQDVAERVGISPGRATQIRQAMRRYLD